MEETTQHNGVSRRTLVKGAAWSVPVVAAAIATPLAAASVGNAQVSLPVSGALLDLRLFDAPTTIAANLLPTGPDQLRIQNGSGAIAGPITASFTVAYASGLSAGLLSRPHGIGVRAIAGATRTSWTETAPSGGLFPPPYTVTSTFDIPAPIGSLTNWLNTLTYNYSQQGAILGIGALVSFSVNVTVTAGGTTVGAASGSFSAPLNVTGL